MIIVVNRVEEIRVVDLELRDCVFTLSVGAIVSLTILIAPFIQCILLLDKRISLIHSLLCLVCSSIHFIWRIVHCE